MKFYNRKNELAGFSQAVLRAPNLILVRGRRRVGKTSLILNILKDTKGIYLYVHRKKKAKELFLEFEEMLRHEWNLPEYVKIEKWSSLFEIIFSHKAVVAIDEFQRLLEIDPSAITQLQDYWDRLGQKSKTALVLSGSNTGMIKRIVLETGAPLFKRARFDLFLKPFKFSDIREVLEDLGVKEIEEQIKIYSICGGIPYYYVLLEGKKISSWRDVVNFLLLNPFSPLKREVRETMIESFGKEHPNYYAIISAIAMGKTTKKEISDYSGIDKDEISKYLYDLEDLVDVIKYEIPITEKRSRTRRGIFRITDDFFRFWFHYIFRNISYYEEQNYDYLNKLISKDIDSHIGPSFEKISKEFMVKLNNNDKLPSKFSKIGRWWSRKGDEIDLVMMSEDSALFVECKWNSKVDAYSILKNLVEKEKLIEHKKKNVYYAIVARGFKSKTKDALCFDLEDLHKVLKN
jgi:AAA+ ATPase superfamily predicted ATPase